MIPIKLELTNFLSYRETAVLPFNGIHLACISGANGAGKSSILDAITWVLFGKSRCKSDDDLVHRLAVRDNESATVQFTFRLEKATYQIVRQRQAGKRSILELMILADDESWKTLTLARIRDTQAEIEKLLRMNYETFTNASFLLQGKADEFTTKTPGRRKQILSDLLGLGMWDIYRDAASERRKAEEGRLILLDAQMADIEQELAEETEREVALTTAKQTHALIAQRLQDKQTLLAQSRLAAAAIEQQKRALQNLTHNLKRSEQTLQTLRQQQSRQQSERDAFAQVLADRSLIESQYSAWQTAVEGVSNWQTKSDEYNRLNQERQPHLVAVTRARTRLEERRQELNTQRTAAQEATIEQGEVTEAQVADQARLVEIQTSLAELAEQDEAWQAARASVQRLEGERELAEREVAQLQQREVQMENVEREKAAVLTNLDEAAHMLATLLTEQSALESRNQTYLTFMAERDNLNVRQPALREQMNNHRDRIEQLQASEEGLCPLCGQTMSESHRSAALAELESEGRQMGDEFRQNKTRLVLLQTEIGRLETDLKQRPKLEQNIAAQRDRQARAEARQNEIDTTLRSWESGEASRLTTLQSALADETSLQQARAEMARLQTAVQKKGELDRERQNRERSLAGFEARLTEIARTTAAWERTGAPELAQVSARIAAEDYDETAQQALAGLDEAAASLGYDHASHEEARADEERLASVVERRQLLAQAEAAVKPLDDTLAALAEQIERETEAGVDLQGQMAQAELELGALTGDGLDLRRVEDEVNQLREEEIDANRRVGAAQNRLDILADQRARKDTMQAERVTLSEGIRRWRLLETAFGSSGVQSLLIEQAIPEIEQRANELVDRLTGGEMTIRFDTQRQLKSRDAKTETLDIRIIDNAGERPYDNFSGGEQFRVNFAIRLALSQVLANRAGARLQTLVIDEGFGSQDPSGRQRLIEAINLIRDEFELVLVITHIDELRDAFPVRIEVAKRPTGSVIAVTG